MSVDTIIYDPNLARVARELEALRRNAIRIRATVVDEQSLAIGDSKLGGLPDLPPEIAWPISVLNVPPPSPTFIATQPDQPLLPPDGRIALPFIAQIRLSDVTAYDPDKALPPSGMLYFFHDAVAYFSDTGASIGSQQRLLTCDADPPVPLAPWRAPRGADCHPPRWR